MIDVLLATYNGEAFLAEQIESVLAQEGVALRILARDDGSSDGTKLVLDRYEREYSGRVRVLRFPGRLGGRGSFGWLVDQAQAPYVAFCDQDDVWNRNKLLTLLTRMQSLETRLGKETPILVHSDLVVVNAGLTTIHPSFWAYSGIDPTRQNLSHILIKNPVTGCALLANRALIEKACPIPEQAAMHDHWFALVAAAFGHIEVVRDPLVQYRQHGDNSIGAKAYGWCTIFRRLLSSCGRMDIARLLRQAGVFYTRFATQFSLAQDGLVGGFARLPELGWVRKRLFLLRHGILMPGMVRNLALLFCVRFSKQGPEPAMRQHY